MFRDGTTRHGERDGPLATAILSWLTRIIYIVAFFLFLFLYIFETAAGLPPQWPTAKPFSFENKLFSFLLPTQKKKITFCEKKENFIYTHGRTYIIWIQLGIWNGPGERSFWGYCCWGRVSSIKGPAGPAREEWWTQWNSSAWLHTVLGGKQKWFHQTGGKSAWYTWGYFPNPALQRRRIINK